MSERRTNGRSGAALSARSRSGGRRGAGGLSSKARAALRSSSCATRESTRPARSACSARNGLPVSIICIAVRTPATRTLRTVAPKPGWIPSSTSGSPREPLIAHRHAVAAGEGEFQTPAESEAVQGGHGRAAQGGEVIEHLLAAADEPVAARLIGERGEFLDVGSGHEAAFLGRDQHDTRRWFAGEGLEVAVELGQYRGGEHVGGGARLVDGEPDDALGVPLYFPGGRVWLVHRRRQAALAVRVVMPAGMRKSHTSG